jgi:hypothetical protein
MDFNEDDINKARWKFMSSIMECILQNNGVLFGGVVRDIFTRDYYASKFYSKYGKRNGDGSNWEHKYYTDHTFDPETKDRYMFPKDIDASMSDDNLKLLFMTFHRKHFNIKTLFIRDAKKYIPNISVDETEVLHYRLKITPDLLLHIDAPYCTKNLIRKDIKNFHKKYKELNTKIGDVIIDLMVNVSKNDYDPPFGNLDFECNGLVMNKDGIRLSRYLQNTDISIFNQLPLHNTEKIANILKCIINKIAIPIPSYVYNDYSYRVVKILSKGYNIQYEFIDIIDNTDEQQCIICHENILHTKQVKLKCCNARYHKKCFIQAAFNGDSSMTKTNKCIMCRRSFSSISANVEFELFRQENIYNDQHLLTYNTNDT